MPSSSPDPSVSQAPPPVPPDPGVTGTRLSARPCSRALPWVAAAALAIGCGWLAVKDLSLKADNASLRAERDLAEIAVKQAQGQLAERTLLAERMINDLGARLERGDSLTGLRVAPLAPPPGADTGTARATVVWAPGQETGLISVTGMPSLPVDRDYQLWIGDPALADFFSGGVLAPGPTGQAAFAFKTGRPIGATLRLVVTSEKKGGSTHREGPIVLQGP